jgi:hypothetical protein
VCELIKATGPMRTFPTRFPTLTVDHIFLNEAIQPLSVTLHRSALARIASDHFPLVAEFVLSSPFPRIGQRALSQEGTTSSPVSDLLLEGDV